jgi:hypothetical protein
MTITTIPNNPCAQASSTGSQFTPAELLGLLGGLSASFEALHGVGDQWLQTSRDAVGKGLHGSHLVYVSDGKPVTQVPGRTERVITASAYGRRCAARHVASYSALQLAGAFAVTRVCGVRVPARALLVGAAINAVTHGVLDRREPLLRLAAWAKRTEYIEHATVVRKIGATSVETSEKADPDRPDGPDSPDDPDGPVVDVSGPGTALTEMDQAAHRAIGLLAAGVTTWLVAREATR